MRILVTGGTGLIGSRLIPQLTLGGHSVVLLTRNPDNKHDAEVVVGDPSIPGPWLDQLVECDAVVHLAGENLFKRRWTDAFLRVVRDSRVESTQLIAQTLAEKPFTSDGSPRVLINASAVGYYGDRGSERITEESSAGTGLLADICQEWEAATEPATSAGVRVSIIRTGVVLSKEGGALPMMARPFRFFVGGRVGSGKQYVSWIHQDDLVGLIQFALLTPEACGPINGTAPEPVTNAELSRTLGKVLGRPSWLPAPCLGIRVVMGRVSEVVCGGQRVIPERAEQLGYSFRFPTLEPALRDALSRTES